MGCEVRVRGGGNFEDEKQEFVAFGEWRVGCAVDDLQIALEFGGGVISFEQEGMSL